MTTTSNHAMTLFPTAYHQLRRPVPKLARSSRVIRGISRWMLIGLVATLFAMLFTPWWQNIRGRGSVIAYAPLDRQQSIEARTTGILKRWGDNIYENAFVEKGQFICEIVDVDADLLGRLEGSEGALLRTVESFQSNLEFTRQSRSQSAAQLPLIDAQVQSLEQMRDATMRSYRQQIDGAREKIAAARQEVSAAEATLFQAEQDYNRQATLYRDGIVSQLKAQEAEQKYRKAVADAEKAHAYVTIAERDLDSKREEAEAQSQSYQNKIDDTRSKLEKTRSEVSKLDSDIAKIESEIAKAEKDLYDIQSKVAQQRAQVIVAPRDGYLTDLRATDGQLISRGDIIATLVPDTDSRAVQLWVSGNDVPLVEPGRHVRLQFEGWPAIQFAGWPSVAVGTFGGTVASIDARDNGRGQFRVLVLPDDNPEQFGDEPWPDQRYLRQGVQANGWVILDRVSLGYEMWRRLNGFPPVTIMDDKAEKGFGGIPKPEKTKPPKIKI